MARSLLRHLFGDTRKKSSQKPCDPASSPISEEHVLSSTPMWRSSLRLASVPAYIPYDEEEDDEQEGHCQDLWYRDWDHPPGCPCCIEGTGFPRPPSSTPGSSDYGGTLRKVSRVSTHISAFSADSDASPRPDERDQYPNAPRTTTIRVRRSVSSFGLRVKRSMKNLNRRPSGSF